MLYVSIKKKGKISLNTRHLPHLQWRPRDELESNKRTEEFGQTETDIRIPIACKVQLLPGLKVCLYAVQRVEIIHHIFENLL